MLFKSVEYCDYLHLNFAVVTFLKSQPTSVGRLVNKTLGAATALDSFR